MHIKRLILVAVFILFPCAQVLFVASQAEAARCCMCGRCNWYCTCPGQYPCDWCAAPTSDPETVESAPPTDHPSANVNHNGIPAVVLSSATERVLSDIRRGHGRETLALKLVDNIKYDLKFSCPQADDNYLQGERLGFQAKADKEN
jgi:hypothetical protein